MEKTDSTEGAGSEFVQKKKQVVPIRKNPATLAAIREISEVYEKGDFARLCAENKKWNDRPCRPKNSP